MYGSHCFDGNGYGGPPSDAPSELLKRAVNDQYAPTCFPATHGLMEICDLAVDRSPAGESETLGHGECKGEGGFQRAYY